MCDHTYIHVVSSTPDATPGGIEKRVPYKSRHIFPPSTPGRRSVRISIDDTQTTSHINITRGRFFLTHLLSRRASLVLRLAGPAPRKDSLVETQLLTRRLEHVHFVRLGHQETVYLYFFPPTPSIDSNKDAKADDCEISLSDVLYSTVFCQRKFRCALAAVRCCRCR